MESQMTPAALRALLDGGRANAARAMTPGGIEAQEAEGQRHFVAEESLPIDCPRAELETLGFTFGDPIDDIFIACTFPDGWMKRPTEHSMWSELLDKNGRSRGMIFYKAAFYDRNAHMSLMPRYRMVTVYKAKPIPRIEVRDGDAVLFTAEGPEEADYYASLDPYEEQARNWLAAQFPDYRNPLAYWD